MDRFARNAFNLSPKKRALFEKLRQEEGLEIVSSRITRRQLTVPPPLSFAQQRLWFLDQLETGSSVYNISRAFALIGSLDIATFYRSLNEIIRRHEALRTTFGTRDGQPIQVIAPTLTITPLLTDLAGLSVAEREAIAQRLAREEAQQPFVLSQGPLIRFRLLRLSIEHHMLLITLHHAVCDGWSFALLLRELSSCYAALVSGQPSPLAELPLQYSDFTLWQREQLQGDLLEKHLTFWKQELVGAPTLLELPTDHPRPPIQGFQGAHFPFTISPDLSRALLALGQQESATPFMLLLSTFTVLLSRYSGQEDLLIGTPIANRQQRELEDLIGFFANTLLIRADLSGAPGFRQLLTRIRERCLNAYAHQDLPFEKLVEELAPERSLSFFPLFQVMFSLQSASLVSQELPGLTLHTPEFIGTGTARVDLMLTIVERHEGLSASFEYNTDLFEAATIERMAEHYQTLLAGLLAQPNLPVTELSLLSPVERELLLHRQNLFSDSSAPQGCIHHYFEQQVDLRPDTIALVCGENQLSYQQLNRSANQLAKVLRQAGVGPEVSVGICLHRSGEMVIALLATLKAGGVYVPLDPALPPERLSFLLQDAQIAFVLTESQLLSRLPDHTLPTLCLDEAKELLESQDDSNLATSSYPLSLAYIMYTSGSTGTPKGVGIPHQGVLRLVIAPNYVQLDHQQTLLVLAPLAFDLSTFEIWGALLNGARLVIAPAPQPSLAELAHLLKEMQITTLWLTSGLFHQMVEEQADTLASIPQLLAGGDVLSLPVVRQLLALSQDQHLINGYGPTENTTFTSCHIMYASDPYKSLKLSATSVPIGTPINQTTVYVLDAALQPVPIGVVGELYTGGVGLARGYIDQPDLTAARFVPDPFSKQPGARLYRTGDLARYLPDGTLAFMGRRDQQIKLRGYRIELDEIETVLSQHPAIVQAVVLPYELHAGDKRLVAYIVPTQSSSFSWLEVRAFLQERLPDYMLPAGAILLTALPLTPNGKLDRRALPAPDEIQMGSGQQFHPPRTEIERLLAGIWEQVLAYQRVGLYDHFFELGGHSLLATQVIARLRSVLQMEIPLRTLFEAPTLVDFASSLSSLASPGPYLPPLTSYPHQGNIPLSFAQQRLWFLEQLVPGSAFYNASASVILRGPLNIAVLEQCLNEIVRRHDILRTSFPLLDGQPIQLITSTLTVPFPMIDLSRFSQHEQENIVRQLASEDAGRPFDLARGPLIRACLLCLDSSSHILLLTLHHIVYDGWSRDILLRELIQLYSALLTGEASPLPQLPIQYRDFTLWQRQWLQGEALEQQLNYWKHELAGAPTTLELPADHPRPPIQSFEGERILFTLSPDLSQNLSRFSRQEGVTLFMTLLSAFAVLLSRYSGQQDLLIGTPIANRQQRELEDLIGFFANTLLIRADLSGSPGFRQLLTRIRERCLSAYAHQDLPFEKLVEELAPERRLNSSPLFQVAFMLQNASSPPLPGSINHRPTKDKVSLTIQPLEVESNVTKFDLTLSMTETEQSLKGILEYNTDLFEAETIERMVEHYQILLAGLLAQPDQSIAQLPLLSMVECELLLHRWNPFSDLSSTAQMSIHERFEQQVQLRPDAIALVCGENQLSYQQINHRANQLAKVLRQEGVGPEVSVGICLHRSGEMVIALLATLKAGGVYVPLDPALPTERLTFLLQDAQVAFLLTESQLLSHLPAHPLPTLCLDQAGSLLACENEENISLAVNPLDLAYIMYTSGSTGTPKGVGIPHQAVLRLITSPNYVQLDHQQTLLLMAPLSFDASTFEIWGALLNGARLVIASDQQPSLAELARLLKEMQVTTLWLTAGLFHQMVEEQAEALGSIPQLLAGGEVLNLQVVRHLLAHGQGQRLINGYGPTENTTFTCCFPMQSSNQLPASATSVPIGAPINQTTVYVLDAALQPVPIGVVGELYTGGVGLARGYVGQPDLTAARFVPYPFSKQPGARLYRTGDRVRYLPDGTLEFVGRRDRQIKLRGYRIELGEIETTLREHREVQEAIVDIYTSVAGDKRLVAYVVAQRRPKMSDLRSYLQARLPEYMLPSTYILLDNLPLTPNGKLDRKALPLPDSNRPELDEIFVSPHTEMERLLAGIWEQVLGCERVGLYDHFFELGGHSLLATQVIARLRSVLQVEIPLRTLFEATTLSSFAAALTSLTFASPLFPPLVALPHQSRLPLSFAQQRLWFLEQWDTNVSLYSIPVALHLMGALNTVVLEQSLNEIIRRHDILRTSFPLLDGHPIQLIDPDLRLELPILDLRGILSSQQVQEIQSLESSIASQPFDLTHGPLLRAYLFHVNVHEWVLLLNVHHTISDGWSLNILLRELTQLYPALLTGQASPLPDLAIQYSDFTFWQEQWLQGETLELQLNYWKHELAGVPTMLELPADHPRPSVQSFQGAHSRFELSSELSQALLTLSRQEAVTPFMLLLSAFAVLLSRYSGQQDLLIGTPIANRQQHELEDLIGFFANTLVLRADLSGAPGFRQLLARIRQRCLSAYAHQDLPFEKLVEAIQPERNLSHSPLFQVMFTLQNAAMDRLDMGEISVQPRPVESGITKFDLSLIMLETEQGFRGTLEYNTSLFEKATIRRMIGHWQYLLEEIINNSDQQISRLSLLPENESTQLLQDWSGREPAFAREMCLHQFFESQVEQRPEAIAVVYEDEQLTYQEVDRRANQLAHYLQKRGVGPEILVGLYLERSLEMIVGLLAILKAGGALLPLDPGYPTERLTFMINDAHALVVLTNHELASRLALREIPLIYLTADADLFSQESTTRPQSAVTPANLAYVMYTSGSTGQPKGVMVTHRAIGNRLQWGAQDTRATSSDHMLLVASLSFDIALWELFGPWMAGGRLILARPGGYQQSNYLLSLLIEQQITVAHFVPGVLQLLVEDPDLERCDSLRCVLYGGEASSAELVRRFFARLNIQLHQFYGPTEASINATCWQCEREPLSERVSIGRPIAGMQIYLLDAALQPVPIGVTGEIYIGGVGLARGYLNRAELTAERFVPHLFSQKPGARLYRTGDLARYLPDGKIEFVGRRDEQVKLRGYRIELGEIEAVLRAHPSVQEAVVLMREDTPGEKRLVAYMVARQQSPSFSELRHYIQQYLPDYMVPSAFVQMKQLPLTPNEKIDRRALPEPDGLRPELETTYLAPQTPIEQTIAAIWQEVLQIEKAGLHDNFFDLGGYSLLIIRVQNKLQAALKREIAILDLFKHPTISALAEHINQIGSEILVQPNQDRAEKLKEGKSRLKLLRGQSRREPTNSQGDSKDFHVKKM